MSSSPATSPTNPDTGWRVWGQRAATAELRNALRAGPGHAYILSGPSGCGKRTAALEFARALCCAVSAEPDGYCGECSSCRRIGRGVYPDVTVFDLKGQAERDRDKSKNLTLSISTIREVSAAVAYRPAESAWRVAIVDDAESMQETAQEAFLKTLEEPPSYAVIFLVTSDIDALLPTIRSRCVTVRFGLSPITEIDASLVAGGTSLDRASQIASLAQGEMGWAFAAVGDEEMIAERAQRGEVATHYVLADQYARMVMSIRLADEYGKNRDGVIDRLRAVQGVWRSAMYEHQGVPLAGGSRLGALQENLSRMNLDDLVRATRSVDDCIASLTANVRPRLALEVMISAWPASPTG
jgi:DNA polymerase-3 subunit delta'